MMVYLKPHSTFPELHSDTLFGAIFSAINELYPNEIEKLKHKFIIGEPPFILSSAFPFINNKSMKIRFYPKIIFYNDFTDVDMSKLKKYKKIQYVDEEIFFDLLNGDLSEENLINNLNDGYKVINQTLLTKSLDNEDIKFSRNVLPHNKVNRLTNKTEIFFSEGKCYKNAGLFFMIKFFDEYYKNMILSAIKFLKDRGFGKDISIGNGHFNYEISDNNVSFSNNGNNFVSLSRFIPFKEDIKNIKNDEKSFYEIGFKRGRHSSGEIRKQIRFFKEGSSFTNYNKYYGKMVESGKIDLAIEYGYAFPAYYGDD